MIHSKIHSNFDKAKMNGWIYISKDVNQKGWKIGMKNISEHWSLKEKNQEMQKKMNGKIIPMIIIFILKSTDPVSFQRKFKNII